MRFQLLIIVLLSLLLGPNKLRSVLNIVQPTQRVPMIIVLLGLLLGPNKLWSVLNIVQPTDGVPNPAPEA